LRLFEQLYKIELFAFPRKHFKFYA